MAIVTLQGKYDTAKVFTENIDAVTIGQIIQFLNQPFAAGANTRIMPDTHAGKGAVIGTTMRITDKVVPNLVGVDIGCLDKDTEYLTPNGWKNMDNYHDGDMVLQYNKENDTAEFSTPLAYINNPCDTFLYFRNSKGLDQMLSDEHKVLLWKGYKSRGYSLIDIEAKDLSLMGEKLDKGYYGVKAAFNINNQKGVDMTDSQIKLDVMITADGTIKHSRENEHQVYMHVKKQRKINRIKELLDENKIPFKETKGKYNSTHIYFFIDKSYNKDLSKYWCASREQLKIIADECLLWDGHKGYRSYFSSTNKQNSDIVQFAFASNNIRAGISVSTSDKGNWNDVYVVTPTKNNIIAYTNTVEKVASEDGRKYCFTMPSGYFVIRRNGRISITGNCGMLTVELKPEAVDFSKLDGVIRKSVPSGQSVRSKAHQFNKYILFDSIKAPFDLSRAMLSMGTLGGGNHFIEMNKADDGRLFLVIHSGSRHLGVKVATYHQEKAIKMITGDNKEVQRLIESMKNEGRQREIHNAIEELKKKKPVIPKELMYLEGESMEVYIRDLRVAQDFAKWNRAAMASTILAEMGLIELGRIDTIHNYIDMDHMILRKGAISARLGEQVLIPINMRDGSILARGKGNADWNESAPHGAGRILSRSKAKELLSLDDYQAAMAGVYSTSVSEQTLDEAPFAYKPMDEIIANSHDTIEVEAILRPLYNFKAS